MSERASATTSDPTSVLTLFDALGVFAELNGASDSLSTPQAPWRAAPLIPTTSSSSDKSEIQSSFDHHQSPRCHFSGFSDAVYGNSIVRMASPVPFNARHEDPGGHQFTFTCSLHESHSSPAATEQSDGDYQSPEKKQKTSVKKKKKPSGQRQREELKYLRNMVTELKDKLQALKYDTRMALSTSADTVPTAAALWLELAQRQQEARERAEAENAELRAQVDAQLKFAKSLERAMQKRTVCEL